MSLLPAEFDILRVSTNDLRYHFSQFMPYAVAGNVAEQWYSYAQMTLELLKPRADLARINRAMQIWVQYSISMNLSTPPSILVRFGDCARLLTEIIVSQPDASIEEAAHRYVVAMKIREILKSIQVSPV